MGSFLFEEFRSYARISVCFALSAMLIGCAKVSVTPRGVQQENPALVAETSRYRVWQVRWEATARVHGEGLLLEDAVREQVLLAVPLKVICREDCKGLCPHCGANQNLERCSCSEPMEDPRWTALKDIRSKLED